GDSGSLAGAGRRTGEPRQRPGGGARGSTVADPSWLRREGDGHENLAGGSQARNRLEAEDPPENHGAKPPWPAPDLPAGAGGAAEARQGPRVDSVGPGGGRPAGSRDSEQGEGPRVAGAASLRRLPGPAPGRTHRKHLGLLQVMIQGATRKSQASRTAKEVPFW